MFNASKQVLKLASPLVAARLVNTLVTFITLLMIARLGHIMLAASALAYSVYTLLLMVSWGMLYAIAIVVGRAYGAKKYALVGHIVRRGLLLSVIVTIPVVLIMWNVSPVLELFRQRQSLIPLVAAFLHAVSWGMLPAMLYTGLQQYAIGVTRSRLVMITSLINLPLTVGLSYIFIFGHFGIPRLGLAGWGYAYAISFWVLLSIVLGYILFDPHLRPCKLFSPYKHVKKNYMGLLVRVGWPIGMQFAIELGLFFTITILMGLFGEVALAAQQIVVQVYAVIIMVPFGIAQATSILIGQAWGRRDRTMICRYGYISCVIGLFFAALIALLFLFFPNAVIGLYLNIHNQANLAVVQLTTLLLAVAAFSQCFDGVRNIMTGALRGLQQTRFPMLVGGLVFWVIGLPVGYLLAFPWHLGPVGVALGFLLAFIIGAIILLWRFYTRREWVLGV